MVDQTKFPPRCLPGNNQITVKQKSGMSTILMICKFFFISIPTKESLDPLPMLSTSS